MPENNGKVKLGDGFTPVPNDHLEMLYKMNLNGREMSCVLFAYRKTYGWEAGKGFRKAKAEISYVEFANETYIDRDNVDKVLRGLVKKRILFKEAPIARNNPNVWGINPPEFWDSTIIRKEGGVKSDPTRGVKSDPTRGVKSDPTRGVKSDPSDHLSKEIERKNKEIKHTYEMSNDSSMKSNADALHVDSSFSFDHNNEMFSQSDFHENILEDEGYPLDVDEYMPTDTGFSGVGEEGGNFSLPIVYEYPEENLIYSVRQPKSFESDEDCNRWEIFIKSFFARMDGASAIKYESFIKEHGDYLQFAHEHIRIISALVFAYTGLVPGSEPRPNKYGWWEGCKNLYTASKGDLATLEEAFKRARDYNHEVFRPQSLVVNVVDLVAEQRLKGWKREGDYVTDAWKTVSR